jgi:hypothetical protein
METVIAAVITAVVGPILVYLVMRRIGGRGGTPAGAPAVPAVADPLNDDPVLYGSRVAIETCDGSFVSANLGAEDKRLTGRVKHVKAWEVFEVCFAGVPPAGRPQAVQYGDLVALLASDNRYVHAHLEGKGELSASWPEARGWETFTLEPVEGEQVRGEPVQFNRRFALRAFNGRYVRFDRDGSGGVAAEAERCQEWETFRFRHVPG